MKKQLLIYIVILLSKNCFSQNFYYLDTISFEGTLHGIIIDTVQANNIWQVGKPSKIIFNSAHSPPNAIVTDTLNPYPANNISSFSFCEVFSEIDHLSFWHKFDTDSGHAGGYIEVSTDGGTTWHNIISDTIIRQSFVAVYASSFYDSTKKITGGIPAFTGNSNSWIYSEYNWENFCAAPASLSFIDTVCFRFTFKSDSLYTGKDGWMIDNISFEDDICSYIQSLQDNADHFIIFPNPVISSFTLQFNSQLTNAEVVIYDVLGKEMLRKTFSGDRMEIDRGGLESGVYFVRVRDGVRQWVEKMVVE